MLETTHLNLFNGQLYIYNNDGIYRKDDLFLQNVILQIDANATERNRIEVIKYLKII
jgi:hypothetical protein